MIYFRPDPKSYSQPKVKKGLTQKERKPTGELAMFKEIYLERGGKCEITGKEIEFHPIHFLHILSKGAYPRFRLKKENIIMAIEDIHLGYDNGSKEYLLSVFPKAIVIYNKKDELRIEYYKKDPTV
jgi:hypothetical protein